MKYIKSTIQLCCICLYILTCLFSQTRLDVIYLNDGEIIKGKIIENVPNEFIKVESKDKQITTIEYSNIQKFSGELDLTNISPIIGKGQIIIRTEPPNSIIIAGGKSFGESPVLITGLPSGNLPIQAEKDGIYAKMETVYIDGVEQQKIVIVLEKKMGSVQFESDPEQVDIYLDGKFVGETPFYINDLEIGQHEVIYQKEDYLNIKGHINILYNSNSIYKKDLTLIKDLVIKQKRYNLRSKLWFGASAIVTVAGGYLYLQADKEYEAYKNAESVKLAKEKHELVESLDNVTPIAFGSAGVIAIPAIYYLVKSIVSKNVLKGNQNK